MEWTLIAALAGLALIDSTSVGTLVIPLWMLLEPRPRVSRFLLYLGTVAAFYFVVGVLLTAFAGTVRDAVAGLTVLNWIQLGLGAALLVLSFVVDPGKRRRRRGTVTPADRWRARLSTAEGSPRAMIGLGVTAAGIEVMSMLPYLGAIGLLTTSGLSLPVWLPTLAAYVLIMVVPALILLAVRLALGDRVQEPLQVVSAWLSRHSEGVLGWVLGIAGFLLARDAAVKLGLFGA
ncbi:GAP family protein [Actinoplanes sp. RD1]|uniref:GAP family protein n=1 Tax=Actinoplanes sp. RD1 TaxID=3064538 RepID=UPI002741EEB3|nr:GAP family protein [Actinoplanes sp. RD1]